MCGPVKFGARVVALLLLINFIRELTHLKKAIFFFLPLEPLCFQDIALAFGHFDDKVMVVFEDFLCSLVFYLIDGLD